MSESCTAIIDQLIAERHRQGKTQKQLAQDAQLTQSVIARLESKKAIPQLDTLLKVAAALGCDLAIVPSVAVVASCASDVHHDCISQLW